MAPLSSQLSGVILKHDACDSHLDGRGRTMDQELELKNFENAGVTLAEIWSKLVIDDHPVTAEYITPNETNKSLACKLDDTWYSVHVRESQYFLQVSFVDHILNKSIIKSIINLIKLIFKFYIGSEM